MYILLSLVDSFSHGVTLAYVEGFVSVENDTVPTTQTFRHPKNMRNHFPIAGLYAFRLRSQLSRCFDKHSPVLEETMGIEQVLCHSCLQSMVSSHVELL